MEVYCFELGPIFVPMVKTNDGEKVTTITAIANALSISVPKLHSFLWRFPERFNRRIAVDCNTRTFLLNHKDIFGIGCVRRDLRFLTEDDVLELAILSNNVEFRDRFKEYLSTLARRRQIQQNEVQRMCSPREETTTDAPSSKEDLSQLAAHIREIAERLARLEHDAGFRKKQTNKTLKLA